MTLKNNLQSDIRNANYQTSISEMKKAINEAKGATHS